jgi:hypothetical protein
MSAARSKRLRIVTALLPLLFSASTAPIAEASFHFWKVQEVFTNADGSVQFIELFNNSPGEHFVAGHQLIATSNGNTKTFTFPSNLSNPPQTTGRTMLVATPGFAGLPGGITPDYTLPNPAFFGAFFDPVAASITINYSNFDVLTITGAFLPTNGVSSLTDANPGGVTPSLFVSTNSPTHFPDNAIGSVNVPPSGDYNRNGVVDAGDYVVWRKTRTQSVDAGQGADGNMNGTIDNPDYTHWRARFGNSGVMVAGGGSGSGASANAAVPEPVASALLLLMAAGICLWRRRTALPVSKLVRE